MAHARAGNKGRDGFAECPGETANAFAFDVLPHQHSQSAKQVCKPLCSGAANQLAWMNLQVHWHIARDGSATTHANIGRKITA
jgi:hypothetical protein